MGLNEKKKRKKKEEKVRDRYNEIINTCITIYVIHFFAYNFMKQLHSCKNQWSCSEKNLKDLKDEVFGS